MGNLDSKAGRDRPENDPFRNYFGHVPGGLCSALALAGTTTSTSLQTDQSGTVNTPNAQTNALWAGYTSWLNTVFSSCLGESLSVDVPAAGATITETCHI